MGMPIVGRDRQFARIERYLAGPGRAVVIHGSQGVGKTRLAREVLDREVGGCTSTSLLATPASAAIPFAAVAGLLPPAEGPVGDTAGRIGACRRHLEEVTEAAPMLVLIDDAHWLDAGSLSLLCHLLDLPGVQLLLTVRADLPTPPEITGLWKDDRALRVDLDPLDRADADRLLDLTVDGPVHPETEDALWELSRGNPLFLRELLLAAEPPTAAGRCGAWQLAQPLAVTPRLGDLVATRLDGLGDDERLGLEALTLVEPLGVSVFLDLVGPSAVTRLEAEETIEVTQIGRRRQVRFGHPVYGEVVRATTPHGRVVQVAARLLEVLPDGSALRRTDRAMLAELWSLAGRPGRPELYTDAARQALSAFDHVAAAELAGAAVARGGGFEAQATYGEALVYRGRPEEAERVLASAATLAWGDTQVAQVALLRAHSALFNRGDLAEADRVVLEASRQVDERDCRDQLDAMRALTATLRGDLRVALAASGPVRQRDAPEPRVLLAVLTVSAIVHALLGDTVAARHDVGRAVPLLEPLRDALPLAGDQIRITEVLTELHDGEVSEAVALAEKGFAVAQEAAVPGRSGAWATTLAMTLVAAGRFEEASRLTAVATARLEAADPLGLLGTALSLEVLCAAALRDLRSATVAFERLQDADPDDLRTCIHRGRAEVWLTAAQGDLHRAGHLAVEHGRRAVDASHHVWGAMILHDAVRAGHPSLVRDDLAALSAAHDAGLLGLLADHAAALDDQDPDALREVASRFAAGGAELYAAEAMAQAADVLRRAGRSRDAGTADTVASELLGRCGGVVTPAMLRSKDPLTAREREIATMASHGTSSRRIAEALILSPRTVDNHLASVYRKTGIAGRHELGELALGEDLQGV